MTTATKARSHPELDEARPSDEEIALNRRYCRAYTACAYNQQIHRLVALLEATHKEVRILAEMDGPRIVRRAWKDAGLPMRKSGGWDEETLLGLKDLSRDAGGFAWVLDLFLDFCTSHQVGEAIESADSC